MKKVIEDIESLEKENELFEDYKEAMGLDEKSFSPIDGNSDDQAYGVWSDEVKAWLDLNTLKGLFYNDDWVHILIDRIASKIAAQELRVIKETFQDGEAVYEPDESHPVNELLYNPNENQTYYQWMYSLIVDHCLAGNTIVYKPNVIKALIHIPVEMVQLDFDTNGRLRTYQIIQYNTNYGSPLPREVMRLDPKQVAHIRRPNPSSAMWGLSPFIPARRNILFNRYSMEYLNNFYLKGAQPGLILDLSDTANEKNALRLLRSMELAHTGRKNQRRNMVLPKGVKASTMAQTLADQQLKDYITLNRETIINVLQVPKHELSIAEAGSLGSEEYKTALRNFWSGPLKSIMKSVEASLTKLLSVELGKGRYLEFDLTDVEFLQDDLNQKADLAIKMLQTHTLNEVRAQIFDEQPLEGGDVTPAPKTIPVINPPASGSNINNTSTDIPEEKSQDEMPSQDEKQLILDKNLSVLGGLKDRNPDWWEKRERSLNKDETERFGKIHESVLNILADQTIEAAKLLTDSLRSIGYKSLKIKAEPTDPWKAKLKRLIRNALANFEERWINETLPTLESTLDIGYNAQFILPFNIPNKSEIEALRATRLQNRRDMLEGRLSDVFVGINQTTTDKIMGIIDEGVSNSRTLQDIAKNIVSDISDPEIANSRAMTITRTEVLTATSLGQAAAMQDASEVIPNLKKMWINSGDDRVRGNPDGKYPQKNGGSDHWKLGGEVVGHDEKFSNGLQFPRDPENGDAGEVINCRCTFVPFPGDEADALGIQNVQSEWDKLQGSNNKT